jgi:hypothetical protein
MLVPYVLVVDKASVVAAYAKIDKAVLLEQG